MGKFDVLFNDIITQTRASLPSNGGEHREYSSLTAWPQAELCLGGGDAALELGGSLHGNASFLCATTDENAEITDWVELYGKDLGDMRDSSPYARITLVKLCGDGMGEREVFNAMLDLDISRHKVDPEGFAINYEQAARYEAAKVSRAALDRGISLFSIGACYIEHYKKDPRVRAVTEIFVTDPDFDYAAAEALGRRVQKAMVTMRAYGIAPRAVPQDF